MDQATRGTVDVATAAAEIGVHKLTLYNQIRKGESPVPVIKVGRRLLIPRAALDRLLQGEAVR